MRGKKKAFFCRELSSALFSLLPPGEGKVTLRLAEREKRLLKKVPLYFFFQLCGKGGGKREEGKKRKTSAA